MNDFEAAVLTDLSLVKSDMAVLKNQMASLMGAGQPGRLYALEERLDQHERGIQHTKGAIAAIRRASSRCWNSRCAIYASIKAFPCGAVQSAGRGVAFPPGKPTLYGDSTVHSNTGNAPERIEMTIQERGEVLAIAIPAVLLAGFLVFAGYGWLQEHDARMKAEAQTGQQQTQIDG